MSGHGRPLRFVALVLSGWVAMRCWFLWPVPVPPMTQAPSLTTASRPVAMKPAAAPRREMAVTATAIHRRLHEPPVERARPVPPVPGPVAAAIVSASVLPPAHAMSGSVVERRDPAPVLPDPPASRWSASLWSIVRGGAEQGGGIATPQLGGSQSGVRLAYALAPRLAATMRVAAAHGVRQQEAAVGIEWRPGRLPFRLVVERRIGVAGVRGGVGAGVVGGIDAVPLAPATHLHGYGQAGVILRDGMPEGYADGAVRVSRLLHRTPGGTIVDLSIGGWGAAQRGVARLDAGPALGVTLPIAARRVRIGFEWRQRLAGDARPASGPALSIGADL